MFAFLASRFDILGACLFLSLHIHVHIRTCAHIRVYTQTSIHTHTHTHNIPGSVLSYFWPCLSHILSYRAMPPSLSGLIVFRD